MFVIVYNNSVILGPMRWNRFRFENEIQEECDFSVSLLDRNDNLDAVIVSDNIQILPVQGTENPQFNPKIEFLNGPFWEFTDKSAIQSYRVESLPIDAVKNMLKEQVAVERWNKENSGTKITLNDVEYSFGTDKETRSILQNAVSHLDGINWKHDRDTWILMTKENIQNTLSGILSYVQSCFDWEFNKIQEIDACETLKELDSVIIVDTKVD